MHFHLGGYCISYGKPLFLGSVKKTNWYLNLNIADGKNNYFEITRIGNKDNVEIDIYVWFKESNYVLYKHAQPLLDGQESIRLECSYGSLFGTTNTIVEGYFKVRCNPICTNKKEAFTQTDNVHPNCQSTIEKEVLTQIEKEFAKFAEKSLPSPPHVSDLLQLLNNPDFFPDATLVCGPAKIRVHRSILSLRSQVFADMFKTQMQESRDGTVDIVDLEPDVLHAMLVHIYSGKTDHLTLLQAVDLLLAAEKYQLEELKLVCVEQLKVNMAANNVFQTLLLGDLHNKSLKERAVEFICQYKNFSDLEKTEDWQVMLKERPSLAMEVTAAFVKYYRISEILPRTQDY